MISVSVHVPEMGDLLPSDAAIGTALELVGAKYLQLQTERVGAGLAVDGSAMRPYSPSYLDRKTRAGRSGESYLYLTGKMLRSQRVKVSGGNRGWWRMSVGFTGTRAQARIVQRSRGGGLAVTDKGGRRVSNAYLAAMNDRWRPFVGVSTKGAADLTRVFIAGMRRK